MKKLFLLIPVILISVLVILFFSTRKEKLNIYSLNIQTEEIGIKSQIEIKKSLSLEDKLKVLINVLSKENFENRKIEFLEIRNEGNQKIAYFNLADTSEKDSWYPYFQGSLGAFSTKLSIVESLLQRDYNGKWVDGIKISYNGKYEEFDHINFEDVVYWRNINAKK